MYHQLDDGADGWVGKAGTGTLRGLPLFAVARRRLSILVTLPGGSSYEDVVEVILMASPISSSHEVCPPPSAMKDQYEPVTPSGTAARGRPVADSTDVSVAPCGGRVLDAEKWLLQRMLRRLGNPAIRVVLWDGQQIATSDARPVALVRIRDRRTLLGLIVNPVIGFGDAYSDGKIEVEGDLLEFLHTVSRAIWPTITSDGSLRTRFAQWFSRLHSSTIGRSRRNVHHHYDIRVDFYRMWLDEQLVYTCAYFPDPVMTIDQAQRAKMDYVCHKLRLCPGETVVEAGFGWGALALHMARHYGVRVHAYNLSHAQTLFARQRAEAEGLTSQVVFIEDDYRNISGRFDAFVSVGMLEHVGRKHYRRLGEVINRCLKPEGRGLIHSIGRNQPARLDAWIRRRIVPGAYPPTLKEMLDIFQRQGFSVLDIENLRLHYARTLEHWLARFRASEDRVAEMFDERFVRMWRLYLTGSIAGFAAGTLQLFQVLFTRVGVNNIPWTRAGLYGDR